MGCLTSCRMTLGFKETLDFRLQHLREKPILLNFDNFSAIFYPRA